ncbi:MAG: MOSC domain-containing protein [Silicimonas sp.]|nr:MOSC domain-containing protein [Silicimonas sp.]
MTADVVQIWRHPIKSHGHEALEQVEVTKGQTLPWDRTWAVAHEAAKADGTAWAPCTNFSRGSKAPGLMAITAKLDEAAGQITLSHPDQGTLTFNPDDPAALQGFLDWTRPLVPDDRAQSARILRVPNRGMTDTDFPSVSLGNLATLRALSDRMDRDLDPRRFRINIWIEGPEPWEEFTWVGQTIHVGDVPFHVDSPITRCLATAANPDTGQRDADTLGALSSGWGHNDLGVYLDAVGSGRLALGDRVRT